MCNTNYDLCNNMTAEWNQADFLRESGKKANGSKIILLPSCSCTC